MPIYRSKRFRESALAHRYLDGLKGIEIGGAFHNAFGLNTLNVDFDGALDTEAKRSEVQQCGFAMPIDIVAPGDAVPVADKSFDFVISSHVIEHFFDPIGAIKEWCRIARRYVFIICPQRDALPDDARLPLTPIAELFQRHRGRIAPPHLDGNAHLSRWSSHTFVDMCRAINASVVEVQDPDDKVGNGFTVIIDSSKPLRRRFFWLR